MASNISSSKATRGCERRILPVEKNSSRVDRLPRLPSRVERLPAPLGPIALMEKRSAHCCQEEPSLYSGQVDGMSLIGLLAWMGALLVAMESTLPQEWTGCS